MARRAHRRASTPKSHFLFLQIVARVSQSKRGITVRTIARELDVRVDVVAHCIALHLYLEEKRDGLLNIPPPKDYWIPSAEDLISRATLSPPRPPPGSAPPEQDDDAPTLRRSTG